MTTTPTADAPEPFGTFRPTRLQDIVRDIGGRLPRNWPGRRFSGWLNYLMQTTYRRPVDVVVLGQRMRLHLDNNSCERRLMVTPQFFDPEELAVLRERMADIEGAEDLALLPFYDAAPRALWPRLLIIEDNHREWRRDCIAEIAARGYGVSHAATGNALLSYRGDLDARPLSA